jgi:hypothetical protein
MRLVYDHSPGARAVSVPCLACGVMVRLSDAIIDLEGPPYRAYYHVQCLPVGAPDRAPCSQQQTPDGCLLEHV